MTSLCECGHQFDGSHRTPGTECAERDCKCGRFKAAPWCPGDKVTVVLTGGGYTTRDEGYQIARVEDGLVYVTDGENDEDLGYDATTGEWDGEAYGGFSRRIERA